MAAESGADVHHGAPRCLLGLFDAAAGGLADRSELLRRKRQRRAFSAGEGRDASRDKEGAARPVTEVLEYRPHKDGYLQLELRHYIRRDGSVRERGSYWYFQYHEGGKRKKLYLVHLQDRLWAMSSSAAYESAERTTRS
jgi:hypothetical protein